jgi:hypothetical protein
MMDGFPAISKGGREKTNVRLEATALPVGGDLRQGAQEKDTGVCQR